MGSSAIHTKRYQAFLQKLRDARKHSGLTQRQVADRLEQLQSYVEKCEQGSRRVDAAELFLFARVYNKPVEFFDPGVRGESRSGKRG